MSKILAIDYGQKRVGIAVTDSLQIVAGGLTTVHSKDILEFLTNYIKNNDVGEIIIGYPRQMNNQLSESVKFIDPFINVLKKHFPEMPIEKVDERFTSKMATQTIAKSGLGKKKRQNKELIDKISATIILQSYLEKTNR